MIFVGVLVVVAAADLEQRERARLAGVPLRLRRRDLHRLVPRLDHAELAADQHGAKIDRHQHDQRERADRANTSARPSPQMPRGHRQHDERAGDQRRRAGRGGSPR